MKMQLPTLQWKVMTGAALRPALRDTARVDDLAGHREVARVHGGVLRVGVRVSLREVEVFSAGALLRRAAAPDRRETCDGAVQTRARGGSLERRTV